MNDNPIWIREELIELHNSFIPLEEQEGYDERYVDDHEPLPCTTCQDSGVFMTPNTGAESVLFNIFPCMVCSAFAERSSNEAAVKFVETERLCNFLLMHKWKYVWIKDSEGRILAHKDGKRKYLLPALIHMGFEFHYRRTEGVSILDHVMQFLDLDKIERTLFDG